MTFPITDFSSASIEQVVDVRTPGQRYKRSRVKGNRRPYWQINLTSVPLPYDEGVAAAAYLDSLEGSLTVFPLPNPLPEIVSRGGLANYAQDTGDDNHLRIGNLPGNQQNATRAGDFVQLANHQKVYRLISNKNASSLGRVIADITPPLHIPTTANETIRYGSDVIFQVCLQDYVSMDVSAQNGNYIVFDITLVEQG